METEMESQLRGVSSGQPQLFAEIARCHDLRALPEQMAYLVKYQITHFSAWTNIFLRWGV
jgi:hypothetical protein